MTVAYFANHNYPSHDIKWINYLAVELKIIAIVFLRPDSERDHFNSQVTVYPILKSMPVLNSLNRWRIIKEYRIILGQHKVDLAHFMGGELKCQYGPFLGKPFITITR